MHALFMLPIATYMLVAAYLIVQMVRTLPHLALIPLMIMWFGIGETPKITLIALGSMFPIYLNLFAGIRGADRKLREAASFGALQSTGKIGEPLLASAFPEPKNP